MPSAGPRPGRLIALLLALTGALSGGVLPGCGSSSDAPAPLPRGTVRIEGAAGPVELRVEIAETHEAQRRGLMGRTSLAEDAGMAFVFDEATEGGFWMKDTLIALSIAFWDPDGSIVAILDMDPCRADPCPTYSPGSAYVGAVEVNQGWFGRHGVRAGDRVDLVRDSGPQGYAHGAEGTRP